MAVATGKGEGNTGRRQICFKLIAFLAIFLALASSTMSFGATSIEKYDLDIPAGDVDKSLRALARATGHSLVIPSAGLGRIKSSPVSGSYTLPEALELLLAGTNLSFVETKNRVIAISAAPRRTVLIGEEKVKLKTSFGGVSVAAVLSGAVSLDGPARAQQSPAPTSDLEVITVTGERRQTTVQETSSSLIAFSSEAIDSIPWASSVADLLQRVPNIVAAGIGEEAPTIRGQDTTGPSTGVNAFLGGQQPRTTIQIDGRPLSGNELLFGLQGLYDVERVEVYRGPQTTTQGRNSIAGAIFVVTKDPSLKDAQAGLRAVAGNFATRQFSGHASLPIMEDELAVRVVANWRASESFLNRAPGLPTPEGLDEEDADDERLAAFRAKALWRPGALQGFEAALKIENTSSEGRQATIVDFSRPLDDFVDFEAPAQFGYWDIETFAATLKLSYEASDTVTVSNLTTFADQNTDRLAVDGFGEAEIRSEDFTNELLISYQGNSGISGVFGLYYFGSSDDEATDFSGFGIGFGDFSDRLRSYAAFGEVRIPLFEGLEATLGLRYQNDEQERFGTVGFPGAPPFISIAFDQTFSDWLPKAGVTYEIADTVSAGVTAQKGYNPGGLSFSFFNGATSEYSKETLWNYELFWRAILADGKLRLNGNLFYTDFKNTQRETLIDTGFPFPNNLDSLIRNAEAAKAYGFEAQLQYAPVEGIFLFASVGYLQTSIDRFTASANDAALRGNEFGRAPNLTLTFGGDWEVLRGLTIGLSGSFVGEQYSTDDNVPAERVDAYALVNGRIEYGVGKVRLFAFAQNLLDDRSVVLVSQSVDDVPVAGGIVRPRTFGAGLELAF